MWVTSSEQVPADQSERTRYLTSGCGRGVTFASVGDARGLAPVDSEMRVAADTIYDLVGDMARRAEMYRDSGGVHACGLARDGELLIVREDVGRHNALDKVLGHAWLSRIPTNDAILLSTGRLSYEMTVKAAKSRVPIAVSRSAVTDLAADVADELHFEFDTGLTYEFTDSNLNVGKTYWYAVTSFSIPRLTIVTIPDTGGGAPRIDTVRTPYAESDVGENATRVQLPFTASSKLGGVKVVPNPYRSDLDYTFEQGGWEGLSRLWIESKRVIWFIHLPSRAIVRIFSISGDLVATIEHDDVRRTGASLPEGQEEWHLLSDSGRAIASGVYVFTVESDAGTQTGKFVVIR